MAENPLLPVGNALTPQELQKTVVTYLEYHQKKGAGVVVVGASANADEEQTNQLLSKTGNMVNQYYDLATVFYEWGWGQAFHFAPRHFSESFEASLARHEYFLAHKIGLKEGDLTLDVGCGVGGPLRNISRFAKCRVIGVNNNQYQINRGTVQNERAGVSQLCSFVKTDFNNLPFPDNHFDAVYQIEATAHAADKKLVYAEIFRVLKPGQAFGSYEWCLRDEYDPSNLQHQRIKHGIEEGNALPGIATTHEVVKALKEVGFEVEEIKDLADNSQVPWYLPIQPGLRPGNIQHTKIGKYVSYYSLWMLEKVGLVPSGTCNVSSFLLNSAADNLVLGGQLDIFTPMFFTLARKPKN